jgi:hypothetical protein
MAEEQDACIRTTVPRVRLESYRLESLHVECQDSRASGPSDEAYECAVDWGAQESDAGRYLIWLSVLCRPPADAPARFRSIGGMVWGTFAITEGPPLEEREMLLAYNGAAILHGVLRGLLISATGGCAGGPFLLPTANYVEMAARRKKRQAEAGTAEESPEPSTISR